jgi:heme-degrading monooxygenase HmoA
MHDQRFATLPQPPYYAVIFSSRRRDGEGFGITVAYFESEAAIRAWREQAEHAQTRQRGRDAWYRHFEVRVARVERAYGWDRGDA